ncbi:hypothetical protein KIPB_007896 [Kipferlia bialata]|uniref:Uncharacterized protein n=1 Tax=Kipferlia bialata TaxID=797122 RepID=A0A9K3D0X8_9EUKA|nr:hypothetical protein KIPB_007896 [Kipferlia bialata]|eukprot:g7896.t1
MARTKGALAAQAQDRLVRQQVQADIERERADRERETSERWALFLSNRFLTTADYERERERHRRVGREALERERERDGDSEMHGGEEGEREREHQGEGELHTSSTQTPSRLPPEVGESMGLVGDREGERGERGSPEDRAARYTALQMALRTSEDKSASLEAELSTMQRELRTSQEKSASLETEVLGLKRQKQTLMERMEHNRVSEVHTSVQSASRERAWRQRVEELEAIQQRLHHQLMVANQRAQNGGSAQSEQVKALKAEFQAEKERERERVRGREVEFQVERERERVQWLDSRSKEKAAEREKAEALTHTWQMERDEMGRREALINKSLEEQRSRCATKTAECERLKARLQGDQVSTATGPSSDCVEAECERLRARLQLEVDSAAKSAATLQEKEEKIQLLKKVVEAATRRPQQTVETVSLSQYRQVLEGKTELEERLAQMQQSSRGLTAMLGQREAEIAQLRSNASRESGQQSPQSAPPYPDLRGQLNRVMQEKERYASDLHSSEIQLAMRERTVAELESKLKEIEHFRLESVASAFRLQTAVQTAVEERDREKEQHQQTRQSIQVIQDQWQQRYKEQGDRLSSELVSRGEVVASIRKAQAETLRGLQEEREAHKKTSEGRLAELATLKEQKAEFLAERQKHIKALEDAHQKHLREGSLLAARLTECQSQKADLKARLDKAQQVYKEQEERRAKVREAEKTREAERERERERERARAAREREAELKREAIRKKAQADAARWKGALLAKLQQSERARAAVEAQDLTTRKRERALATQLMATQQCATQSPIKHTSPMRSSIMHHVATQSPLRAGPISTGPVTPASPFPSSPLYVSPIAPEAKRAMPASPHPLSQAHSQTYIPQSPGMTSVYSSQGTTSHSSRLPASPTARSYYSQPGPVLSQESGYSQPTPISPYRSTCVSSPGLVSVPRTTESERQSGSQGSNVVPPTVLSQQEE